MLKDTDVSVSVGNKPLCTLKSWSTCVHPLHDNPYTPPEMKRISVQGVVYGHPKFVDGTHVISGSIISFDGRWIETKRTNYILLGPPDPFFSEYCLKNNIPLDWDNPLKWRTS